jgi:hypothetical protein
MMSAIINSKENDNKKVIKNPSSLFEIKFLRLTQVVLMQLKMKTKAKNTVRQRNFIIYFFRL